MTERRADQMIGAGLASAFFALYCATLCRTVYWYDSAEYVTAAVTLGIPHPPGYPLYTLIAHLFTWLPISPALAVNLMSATFAALAVMIVYFLGRRLGLSRISAAVGAAALGGSKLFWANAVIAEVYCPVLATIALVLYLLVRAGQASSLRYVIAGAFFAGLGLGIHLSIATCGVGFAILVFSGGAGAAKLGDLLDRALLATRLRRCAAAAGAALLGSCIFLYLPLRAAMKPALNFGDPSNFQRLRWHLTGGNYKHWFGDVDFFERSSRIAGFFSDQFLVAGLVFAVAGFIWLARARPTVTLALALAAAGNIYFFFSYRVHDLEVFFLPSSLIIAIFVGAGAQAAAEWIVPLASRARRRLFGRLVVVLVATYPTFLALGHYYAVDLSDFDETDEFIAEVAEGLPADAMIVNFTTPPEWRLDAVFGMYVQKVLGERLDVRVVANPSPKLVFDEMRAGVAVYAYAPVAPLRFFRLIPEHGLFRLLPPNTPAPTPPLP